MARKRPIDREYVNGRLALLENLLHAVANELPQRDEKGNITEYMGDRNVNFASARLHEAITVLIDVRKKILP